MKPKLSLLILSWAIVACANRANAADIYANNISALNINMLSDTFMSYANHGDRMSDLFNRSKILYGTMDRLDEYGDDGSTIKTTGVPSSAETVFDAIWLNANHINEQIHYGQNISEHGRINLATLGGTLRATELEYGTISFGGFASYINTKMPDFHGGGDVIGLFAKYNYQAFGAKALIDTGSLNNGAGNADFNNSWANVATEFDAVLKIDSTFLFRPAVSVGYTFVTSDDLYISGSRVYSKDYHFLNVAPGAAFIKEIAPDWYGRLSAKYIAHFGGKNDINIDDTAIQGLYIDNHTDVGIDIEYNFKQFVFGGMIHKQMGGLDGWSSNINIKYAF